MQKLKPIRLLGFLLILVGTTMHGVVSAQAVSAMNTALQELNLVPTTDAYCDGNYPTASFTLPPNYTVDNPELCVATTVSGTIPAGVVDWILIELRAIDNSGNAGSTNVDNAGNSTVIARKPAFLLSNGRIVDAEQYASGIGDGSLSACTTASLTTEDTNCPDVEFAQGDVATTLSSADLYLVIRHRNHLDIISNTHLSGDSGLYSYDFSSATTPAKGGLKSKTGTRSPATLVMRGGDASGDNSIGFGDFTAVILPVENETLYHPGDADMSGTVGFSDFTGLVVVNENISSVPPIK